MMHTLHRLWQRLRGRRTWTVETANAKLSAELARLFRRVERAGLPAEAAVGSAAANLLIHMYMTLAAQNGPAAAHQALQEVLVAVGQRIAAITGTEPFSVQRPDPPAAGQQQQQERI